MNSSLAFQDFDGTKVVADGLPEENFTSWLEIDLGSLARNIRALKAAVGENLGVIAVVKSDGYGYGLLPTAAEASAAGVYGIGVGNAADASVLRRASITSRVIVLYPVLASQVANLVTDSVELTVTTMSSVEAVRRAAEELRIEASLHIQVETGMHHYGAASRDVLAMAKMIDESQYLKFAGVSTHFSAAGHNKRFTINQHERFLRVLYQLRAANLTPGSIHVANSAALDHFPASWDLSVYRNIFPEVHVCVRVGSILYGTYAPEHIPLTCVQIASRLVSHVMEIKRVAKGDVVGYFAQYRAPRSQTIALLSVGWGSDGFFPVDGHAVVNDKIVPIIGPVGANTCAIDVTDVNVSIGDVVLLFDRENPNIGLDSLALSQGMFIHRLIATLGTTGRRVYVRS